MSIQAANSKIFIVPIANNHTTAFYRAFALQEQLVLAGFKAELASFPAVAGVTAGNIVVLQRLMLGEVHQPILAAMKKSARALIYDIDDFLWSAGDLPSSISLSDREATAKAATMAIRNCSAVMVSTGRLKKLVEEEMQVPAFVRSNVLMQKHLEVSIADYASPNQVIGYSCGSATHDRDFSVAAPAIFRLMEEYKTLQMVLLGGQNLNLNQNLASRFMSRIKRVPFVAFDGLFDLIRRKMTISIAPLEFSKFNSCKSNVKVLEAGVVEVPSVVSPEGMYTETIINGRTGYVARTEEEWYNFLKILIVSESARKEVGRNIRHLVDEQFTTANSQEVKDIFSNSITVPVTSKVLAPAIKKDKSRLTILNYRWHCGHQWELHHLPHDFVLLKSPSLLDWDYKVRPMRDNVSYMSQIEVDRIQPDLAILHFDENVLNPEDSGGVLHPGWGVAFVKCLRTLKIPKVAICHGTVPRMGAFNPQYTGNPWEVNETLRRRIVDFVGDVLVICNSKQAQKDWGFRNSRVIYHGFNWKEYPLGSRHKSTLCATASLLDRPWYEGYPFVKKALLEGVILDYLGKRSDLRINYVSVPEPNGFKVLNNQYAMAKFNLYKTLLGNYRIFFNPTWFSPMPRTRAEAMLVGSCVVTTGFQDEQEWIRNGENGFVSNDPAELIETLKMLEKRPEVAEKVGNLGREVAAKIFNRRQYLLAWEKTIREVLG